MSDDVALNEITYKNRHVSRFIAVLAVYSCLIKEDGSLRKLPIIANKMKHSYLDKDLFIENFPENNLDDLQLQEPDEEFISKLIELLTENEEEINNLINSSLNAKWRFERLDQVIRAILKLATSELLFNGELHQSIIIDEYVSLTKTFYENSEAGFVNKVLDVIAKKVRD